MISDRHVLTAAHCYENGGNFDVIVGEHDLSSSSDGTRHKTCRKVDHPRYSKIATNYDYAIVHLENPVKIKESGGKILPACLPPSWMAKDYLDGKTMTTSGWGKLGSNEPASNVLQTVDVPGITNAECNTKLGEINEITKAMLCAGKPQGGVDSCGGDSGGNFFIVIIKGNLDQNLNFRN